jgi:filamentous hemagglutinin family protein
VSARLAALVALALLAASPARAGQTHVSTDGSLGGGAKTLPSVNGVVSIPANVGKKVGNNLFQSFSTFDLANPDVARFGGPAGIRNVIVRVTGGASNIDGTIDTATYMPGANFFFIDPNGVLFGPNASLNVGGSVHISTADYLAFPDGGRFDARNPGNTVFSSADPSAFGFLSGNPAGIQVSGSSIPLNDGATFSLVGGNIVLDGAFIGDLFVNHQVIVNLIAVASPGVVGLDGSATNPTLGQISLVNGAGLQVPGGPLRIRADDLLIQNSTIFAIPSATTPVDTVIDIRAGRVVLDVGMIEKDNENNSINAGSILIQADTVDLQNSSSIAAQSFPPIVPPPAGTVFQTGDIIVRARSGITLSGNSQINASTQSPAGAGTITLMAPVIVIAGSSVSGQSSSDGRGGDILLSGDQITVQDGGSVTSSTAATGSGGTVTIRAGVLTLNSGGIVSSASSGTGDAGNIEINVGNTLSSLDATISTSTTSSAGGSIGIRGGFLIHFVNSSVTTSVSGGSGNGGNITIDPQFVVLQSSKISADAFGGNGGNIHIIAGNLVMTPDSAITASSVLGVSGTISAPPADSTVGQRLVVLPVAYFDAASRLRAACAARGGGDASTLVGVGRGGMPADPDSVLLARVGRIERADVSKDAPAPPVKRGDSEIQIAGLDRLELRVGRLVCDH